MRTLSSSSVRRFKALKVISIMFAVWVLGTVTCAAASEETVMVRQLGPLDSDSARRILRQVNIVPFALQHDSPILLQGETIFGLKDKHEQELLATYQAGHTIVLLDATLAHIKALHEIIGAGVTYRSKNSGVVLAYALRQENRIPTATLVTKVDHSPLQTPNGDPDPSGLRDEALAFNRAADHMLTELRHLPQVSVPGPREPSPSAEWQDNPLQTTTFAINGPGGVYNTLINVYALHSCLDNTDRYVVTALADWTATNAQWQSAGTQSLNGSPPTMFLDNGNLVINWRDDRVQCSSPGDQSFHDWFNVCRYINYPQYYDLKMVPNNEGTVIQVNAAPPAAQGQTTTYQSGFSFTIGGTVNVSGMGPQAGINAGVSWSNSTTTTIPPLRVGVCNPPGGNQAAGWTFQYCTTGLESDPVQPHCTTALPATCTSQVQMVKDVCLAQLGDDSGTNPQQGQTAAGKFSNAVQSAYWEADPDTRVNHLTFDIEVAFEAGIANTIAHLGVGSHLAPDDPDPNGGCNWFGCACVSETQLTPVSKSFVFEVPFPSTKCD